jgi:uncharacterized protein (TIGR03067 family)
VTGSIALGLAYGLVLGAVYEDAVMNDAARLEGVWRFARVEVEGLKQPEAPFETNKLVVFKDGRYVIVQGTRITRGVVKLDPTRAPKHYDVTIATGPRKGLIAQGLYELEGDTFTVCLPFRSKERPAELVSKSGNGCLLHVFQREKQDIKEVLAAAGRLELTGTWQAISYALNGSKATTEEMKKVQLVIDAEGKATARNDGTVFIAGTIKIDPAQEPMTIDVAYTEGEPKGKTSLGIYKIEDDVLTICRAAPDHARPTEFASKPDSGLTLMAYKREKATTK